MRHEPAALRRSVRGPGDRRQQLRSVRQHLRARPHLQRRRVRLPCGLRVLRRGVRRHEHRHEQLWGLQQCLPRLDAVRRGHMRLRRADEAVRCRLRRRGDRPVSLRLVREPLRRRTLLRLWRMWLPTGSDLLRRAGRDERNLHEHDDGSEQLRCVQRRLRCRRHVSGRRVRLRDRGDQLWRRDRLCGSRHRLSSLRDDVPRLDLRGSLGVLGRELRLREHGGDLLPRYEHVHESRDGSRELRRVRDIL